MGERVPDEMVRRIEEAGGFTAQPEEVAAARFAATLTTVEGVRARYPAHVARYEHAAAELEGHEIRLLIDAGSGAGYGAFILAQRYSHSEVWAIERNPVLRGFAAIHFARQNIHWLLGDLGGPWPLLAVPGSVDAIVCLETIERFKDPRKLLTDFGRALRSRGLLILSTPHKPQGNPWHVREYTLAEVEEALERHGFEILSEQEQRGQEFVELDRAAQLGGRYMFFVARAREETKR